MELRYYLFRDGTWSSQARCVKCNSADLALRYWAGVLVISRDHLGNRYRVTIHQCATCHALFGLPEWIAPRNLTQPDLSAHDPQHFGAHLEVDQAVLERYRLPARPLPQRANDA